MCHIGGYGTPISYVVGFSYFLKTSNIPAGRIVMSPFWDIITLQSVIPTRVAR
jgi:hypothetical protein